MLKNEGEKKHNREVSLSFIKDAGSMCVYDILVSNALYHTLNINSHLLPQAHASVVHMSH